ncbi:MAG: cysteine--tRNA ligase [bacterium]|nr:cysteine--tRNA ligase [bacterium]
MLKLYNYLTRKKEIFQPIRKARVGLYTCGPTVYNYAHIGNLRTFIFEDILRRVLERSGYKVTHIMNLTDVDDKTIRGSIKAGKTLKEFTSFYAREFLKDTKRLNLIPATKYPKATAHIPDMIKLINLLLKKKLAYKTEGGVYFDISKFRPYGKLSRLKKSGLKTGTRVAADEYTKNEARDFALWKIKKAGEPSWSAPYGAGRPGWHIECSSMSMKYLGNTFDIHAGGVDLLFPHHENEIAQSEGATGKPFAKYFIEGEHLLVDGRKMSKSLGNVFTLRALEAKNYDPIDFRYLILGAHYRTQLNFTWTSLEASKHARLGILNSLERIDRGPYKGSLKDENETLKVIITSQRDFSSAVSDDLNTPKALAVLNELLRYGNALFDKNLLTGRGALLIRQTVFDFDKVLGLKFNRPSPRATIPEAVQNLVSEREELRKEKKWKEADKIREKIKKMGFLIEDAPQGPKINKN